MDFPSAGSTPGIGVEVCVRVCVCVFASEWIFFLMYIYTHMHSHTLHRYSRDQHPELGDRRGGVFDAQGLAGEHSHSGF